MTATVKICGINAIDAAIACNDYGADYVGFVFVEKSPRFISYDFAKELSCHFNNKILKTGLFVNPRLSDIEDAFKSIDLDVIQLHGDETAEDVFLIQQKFSKPIIKAVSVAKSEDIETAKNFFNIADIILFDAKAPITEQNLGGNGVSFEWSLLKDKIPPEVNWGLAGGLSPENVRKAIRTTGAELVDVSSGVEVKRGVKDTSLIARFISEAKNA
ncbi:MAG: phosphoribosylanthranilate isomerase [Alphaproteobacteria bacterium]